MAALLAVTMATSYDRYDYGYGIYDDGHDSPTIDISPDFLESMKSLSYPAKPTNAVVYKRPASNQYPAKPNAVHFFYIYPQYQVYAFYH